MDQKRLHALEDQCIQDCAPPCSSACPMHVDVRNLTAQIKQGDLAGAYRTYIKAVPFPGIISRICDQPCRAICLRKDLGGSIQIAALERACVDQAASTPKSALPLPPKEKTIAVVGSGLSGATAALEAARKGYRVVIFEVQAQLGGRCWSYSDEILPKSILQNDYAALSRYAIQVRINMKVGKDVLWKDLIDEYDAVYLGIGSEADPDLSHLLELDEAVVIDPLTFATQRQGFFAGGSALHEYSPILSIADGRRAAISIDRFLQNVSLTAARFQEGPYQTRLYTNLTGIAPIPEVNALLPRQNYDLKEARREAERCIQCECLECVKACGYLSHYGSYPRKYVREIYNNLTIIMRVRSANKFINSCMLCGLCAEICPEDFDMGVVCKEARQSMVKTHKMPVSAHDFALRDMAFSNSEKCALTLIPEPEQACAEVFFPGCQLSASYPQYVPKIYEHLRAKIPNMGIILRCCGAPANWAGREDLFSESIVALRDTIKSVGNPRIILACSSCYQVFKQHMPEIQIISLWEYLAQSDLPQEINLTSSRPFALHDPCSTRYETGVQDSVREIMKRIGVEIVELPFTREKTKCCGYGGVAWLANPDLVQEVVQARVSESPLDYVTYCAMCRDLFSTSGKPILHILDFFFGDDLDVLASRKRPGYSQRHTNRISVKKQIIHQVRERSLEDLESYEKIKLSISPSVSEMLEKRLILVEDIQRVIEAAETGGDKFMNQDTRHYLAFFRPAHVTYWVEYSIMGNEYLIHNAYSHRMEIEGNVNP